jgi:hypothetical protein
VIDLALGHEGESRLTRPLLALASLAALGCAPEKFAITRRSVRTYLIRTSTGLESDGIVCHFAWYMGLDVATDRDFVHTTSDRLRYTDPVQTWLLAVPE